jgi:hypothetical protein
MRTYAYVYTTFWSSPTIVELRDDAKLLALYLLTCQHCTSAGVFRLPVGYASADLGWSQERVREGLKELSENGFVTVCQTTHWVWIRKHLDWNPPENPNQVKAITRVALTVPKECSWLPDFSRHFLEVLKVDLEPIRNSSPTVPKPSRNQKPEPEPEEKTLPPGAADHVADALVYLTPEGVKAKEPKTPKATLAEPLAGNPAAEAAFGRLWENYPSQQHDGSAAPKSPRRECMRLFAKTLRDNKGLDAEILVSAIAGYCRTLKGSGQYIAALKTVLGPQAMWEDYLPEEAVVLGRIVKGPGR